MSFIAYYCYINRSASTRQELAVLLKSLIISRINLLCLCEKSSVGKLEDIDFQLLSFLLLLVGDESAEVSMTAREVKR